MTSRQALHDAGAHARSRRDPCRARSAAPALAAALPPHLPRLYAAMAVAGPYSPDAGAAGRRALRLACAGASGPARRRRGGARSFSPRADNMTEELGALAILLDIGRARPRRCARSRPQWQRRPAGDRQMVRPAGRCMPPPEQTAARDRGADRAIPRSTGRTPTASARCSARCRPITPGFHDPSGAGYRLLADWLIRLDPVNPQTTARMSTAFRDLAALRCRAAGADAGRAAAHPRRARVSAAT